MLPLGVLHTSHYRLHKKAGIFFLILMYPRPCRAKNGVFSTASSAGAAAQIYGKNMARIRGMDSWPGPQADSSRTRYGSWATES